MLSLIIKYHLQIPAVLKCAISEENKYWGKTSSPTIHHLLTVYKQSENGSSEQPVLPVNNFNYSSGLSSVDVSVYTDNE